MPLWPRLVAELRYARNLCRHLRTVGLGAFLVDRPRLAAYLGKATLPVRVDGINLQIRPASPDVEVVRQVFVERQYKLPTLYQDRIDAIYAEILAAGRIPVIIDAGANIGAASVWFADRYPRASIHAIEPDPGNCVVLRRNTAGYSVKVWEAGIANAPGYLRISNPGADTHSLQTERAEDGLSAVDIPTILAAQPNGALFLAKVDIEGFERDLFAANTAWIVDCPVLAVEIHDWLLPGQGTSLPLQRAMAGLDRDLLIKGENLFWIGNRRPA